jgi:hypothetical protein
MKKLMEIISKQFKDSELLTEDVKESIKAELEKMINEKVEKTVKEKTAIVEAGYNQKLAEMTEEGQKKLDEYTSTHANKMNEYVTEAVNEFIEKNELAIDAGIKVERATNLVEGLKSLLTENDINIEEESNDIVKNLESSNTALKDSNERLINEKSEAEKQCFEFEKVIEYTKLVEGLTDVQKDEVIKLHEGIVSNTIDDFRRNMSIIIEKVKKGGTNTNTNTDDNDNITESLTRDKEKTGNGKADLYL